MRSVFMRFPGGKAKAVTLSYDDGCREDLKLIEILNRYGIKCTFNLNSLSMRGNSGLTKEEISEHILSGGHEIAVHGANHRPNGNQRTLDGIRDVLDCRLELEETFGIIVRGMAYPDSGITLFSNSSSYETVKNYLKELDIVYVRTLGGDNNNFQMPADWHAWMPAAHHKNPKALEYADEFLKLDLSEKVYHASRAPRLFYLWGHSYEFKRDNNWDLAEKLCEKLTSKDGIWYATNMEIYDYTTAYNSLIRSADSRIIYNPSLTKVWFDVDSVLYSIKAGETIKIN